MAHPPPAQDAEHHGKAVGTTQQGALPGLSEAERVIDRLARSGQVSPAVLAGLVGSFGQAVDAIAGDAGDGLSETTRRAYRRDWIDFATWCQAQAVHPGALPIDPVLAAAYLATLAGTLGHSALRGRVAAIAHEHRRRGLVWHAGHPVIRRTLQGIARQHGKSSRPAAALTAADIRQLVDTCAGDTAGLRDRALFLVGFAAALRAADLVAIDYTHLHIEAGGVVIRSARVKDGQPDRGLNITLPRIRDGAGAVSQICPVQALERWLARAHIRRGAVFRGVTAGGRLGDRLSPDGVRHILRQRAKLAGLTVPAGERLSPHGLLAGAQPRPIDRSARLGPATGGSLTVADPIGVPDPSTTRPDRDPR